MDQKFRLGSQIKPSAEGLKRFRNWRGRHGTVIGGSRDEKVWEVRWFGRPKTELIHEDFIALSIVRYPELEQLGQEGIEAD